MKIYLAKPMSGYGADEVAAYFSHMESILTDAGYAVMHPMTGKRYLIGAGAMAPSNYTQPLSKNHAIIERDRWMVSIADVVLMDLVGTKSISIGCVMELAWAHHMGKHTIVAIDTGNVHQHAFVLEAADVFYETIDDALAYAIDLIGGVI